MTGVTAADLLERVVGALVEPTAAADLTVGQAVWQLYQALRGSWRALALRPVGGGNDAFDAVYEATDQGLHVLEVQSDVRPRIYAAGDDVCEVPVAFAGEVVAVFRAVPVLAPGGASPDTLLALTEAAPAIGLMLMELAQRRRMHREITFLRAMARMNAGMWVRHDPQDLLEVAAGDLRAAWGVERVRIYVRERSGEWPLVGVATLPSGTRGQAHPLAKEWVAVAEHTHQPAVIRVAPAAWLVPIADDGPPRGALLLDNALTASPLERADDLSQAVRGLAVAWARLPAPAGPLVPLPVELHARPPAPVIEEALGPNDSQAVVWRLLGPTRRARRGDGRPGDEAARAIERLVAPRYRFVVAGPDTFAALLAGASPEAARELAQAAVDQLAGAWRLAGGVAVLRSRPPSAAVRLALDLAAAAAGLYEGAVLAEGDHWRASPDGGLQVADGAVLHPAWHRLDLKTGPVSLTRTEVRILSALTLSSGPIAAGELVHRVWPGDRTMGVMNLYPHVHGLRRRLERSWPGGLRVRTIRGQGYVLDGEGQAVDTA